MKILVVLCLILSSFASARTTLNWETGVVDTPYNRVGVPGDDGTKFSLADSVDESYGYHRFEVRHLFGKHHGLRALYAPLTLTGAETYSKDISFGSDIFPAGDRVETLYRFNSYRLSYFYRFLESEHWDLRVGGTAKIRQARIKLASSIGSKDKENVGLVPLVYFWGRYKFADKWSLTLDLDALAAPQGRAFDGALMGGYSFSDNFQLNLGYRILEGGVDNDNTYNFSVFRFAFASLEYSF